MIGIHIYILRLSLKIIVDVNLIALKLSLLLLLLCGGSNRDGIVTVILFAEMLCRLKYIFL